MPSYVYEGTVVHGWTRVAATPCRLLRPLGRSPAPTDHAVSEFRQALLLGYRQY